MEDLHILSGCSMTLEHRYKENSPYMSRACCDENDLEPELNGLSPMSFCMRIMKA